LALDHLKRGRAHLVEQGHQVGLQREQRIALRAVPAAGRVRRDQGGDDGQLVGRLVALEGGANLEERRVREALAGVAGRRVDQVGRIAGRMQSRSEAIGLESRRRSSPPPNSFAHSVRMKLQVTRSA